MNRRDLLAVRNVIADALNKNPGSPYVSIYMTRRLASLLCIDVINSKLSDLEIAAESRKTRKDPLK